MRTKLVYQVKSDNFDNELLTPAAYRELRLYMSTGDFHTHKAELTTVALETPVICGFKPTGDAILDLELSEFN